MRHLEINEDTRFPSIGVAKEILAKLGYTMRQEASGLPIKYERANAPALTIASDDGGKTYKFTPYPSDKEIFKLLDSHSE